VKTPRSRPTINHISLISRGHWFKRTFLPFYGDQLAWAEDVKCPSGCELATYCHPMVQDEKNPNLYHKLCTLTVIKAGLVAKKEII